uniref:CHK domain-containing protein n=1 Tax=Meloidogyne hapla TaxID=6305 RepID=A0A1I8B2B4_MELHA
MNFLQQQIDPSNPNFTIKFILDHLFKSKQKPLDLEEINEIKNVYINLMGIGGFISKLYRINIKFNKKEFNCIFKIPTMEKLDGTVKYDSKGREELIEWIDHVHKSECRFYNEVLPLLIQNSSISLNFRIPQVYAFKYSEQSENFLLMEDLCSNKNQKIFQVELADGLNNEQVESTISSIAHFHALSLSLPSKLIDSFKNHPDLDIDEKSLKIKERIFSMPETAEMFKGNEEKILNLFECYGTYQIEQHKKFGLDPVIVHGDTWQVVHIGTGINDIVRLIFVCVDAELRRLNSIKWLKIYEKSFNKTIKKLGKDFETKNKSFKLIKEIAIFHSKYECCFQLFLLANILGQEKEKIKREKIIKRMKYLFDDCCKDEGFFNE